MKLRFPGLIACAAGAIVFGSVCEAQSIPRPPRPPRTPSSWFNGDAGATRIDTIVPFSANGSVELSLSSGSIKVTTWDRNQVRVSATTTGNYRLQFDASSSHLDLSENRGSREGRGGTATYDVTVPSGTRATLTSVSAPIDVAGVKGGLDITVVSGTVDVRDAGSSVAVEGVSGNVTARNIAGDLRVKSVSSNVSVSNVTGTLSAETVSGDIDVSGVRGTRVRVTSVSGSLDYTGAINPAGRYDFETHSGNAELKLASNASAAIRVDVFSGSVTNDYPGAVRRVSSGSDEDRTTTYNYILGRGDARVRVETFSGRVTISQENR